MEYLPFHHRGQCVCVCVCVCVRERQRERQRERERTGSSTSPDKNPQLPSLLFLFILKLRVHRLVHRGIRLI